VSKDVTISGKSGRVNGGFILTSVSVYQPNTYRLIAAILKNREIANLSEVLPKGVNQDQYYKDQRAQFDESRDIAAAAAAKAAGMKVTLKGTGARVTDLAPGAPAEKILKKGDVVIGVDGEPVKLSTELARAIQSRPAGTIFDLTIERSKRTQHVKVASRAGIAEGTPAIGILLETRDFDITLPFKVHFKHHDIGGPSAGLAYALAIYDILEPADIAHGRDIATTGTISLEGQVGPIGGIREKAVAAKRAGATLFVVPDSEAPDAKGAGMSVIGVTTLEQAVNALRS
jgi:PDZ domain-containing protein